MLQTIKIKVHKECMNDLILIAFKNSEKKTSKTSLLRKDICLTVKGCSCDVNNFLSGPFRCLRVHELLDTVYI